VAQVVDVELDGAEVFIVTELVEGISLARDIAKNGPWPPSDLASLARDLDQALSAVHAAGVVHRDVKPSNVVLNRRGRPTLIDFGIAQEFASDRLTGTGMVAGTPGFVSPELLRGGDPTPGSDRWAAAALLLNAATGRQPFGSGAVEAVLTRVLDGNPDVAGLPEHVAAAFGEALDPTPERRISLTELAVAVCPDPLGPAGAEEEDLPPTAVAPSLPGEEPGENPGATTDQLWTEPPVVDYRRWVADSAQGPWRPPEAAAFPQPDADRAPLSPYPPSPPATPLTSWAVWSLVSAAALWAPWAAAGVALVGLVAGRTVWMAVRALAMRRFRRGGRAGGRARVAFGLPWHLLRGLMGTLPAVALGLGVGLGGYLAAVHWTGLGGHSAEIGAVAVAVGVMLAWWGPSGQETRDGLRTVVRALAPAGPRRAVFAGLCFGATGLVLVFWPWTG
jgi:hypothetical protein